MAAKARGTKTQVMIVSPSAVRRAGLEELVRENPSTAVAGSVSTFAMLPQRVQQLQPDIVLFDLEAAKGFPSLNIHAATNGSQSPAFIALVEAPTKDWTIAALRAGFKAVLPRDATPDEIASAFRAVASGFVVLHPRAARALAEHPAAAPMDPMLDLVEELTPREVEVLRLLADGLGNKEIASHLGISEHTVKFHVGSILGKLGVTTRTEAVTTGIRRGLIPL
jgi:two-component system, NarL family, response regulator YdfI